MSGNSSEGHDFGLKAYACGWCNGKGIVVEAKAITHDDGTIETWESADMCSNCAGSGQIWM